MVPNVLSSKQLELVKNMQKKNVMRAEAISTLTENGSKVSDISNIIKLLNHEIKLPLSLIKIYLQMVQKTSLLSDQRAKELMEKAEKQVEVICKIADDFLRLTECGNESDALKSEEFNISDMIAELIQEGQVLYPDFKITYFGNDGLLIYADPQKIRQVINNYLNNAVKYSGQDKRVEIYCDDKFGQINLSVRDFGIGIDESLYNSIFECHFRADNPVHHTIKGSGLGLHIVKTIIEAYGGQVGVCSAPGKGSTFHFALPKNALIN